MAKLTPVSWFTLVRRLRSFGFPGLYLYGSYARGEERPGSDLDVAMILDKFERPWFEIQRTSQLVSDLSLEYDIIISLIPLRASDWKEKQKSLVRNIYREGVAV